MRRAVLKLLHGNLTHIQVPCVQSDTVWLWRHLLIITHGLELVREFLQLIAVHIKDTLQQTSADNHIVIKKILIADSLTMLVHQQSLEFASADLLALFTSKCSLGSTCLASAELYRLGTHVLCKHI